jgi:hypothetical protein
VRTTIVIGIAAVISIAAINAVSAQHQTTMCERLHHKTRHPCHPSPSNEHKFYKVRQLVNEGEHQSVHWESRNKRVRSKLTIST